MQEKSNTVEIDPAASSNSCSFSSNTDQALLQRIGALDRRQRDMYSLINRLRRRVELQRRVVANITVRTEDQSLSLPVSSSAD